MKGPRAYSSLPGSGFPLLLAILVAGLGLLGGADIGTAKAQAPQARLGEPAGLAGSDARGIGMAPARDRLAGLDFLGCGGQNAAVVNADYEQTVVELSNVERLNNGGLPPLKRRDALDEAARYHVTDLRQDNYFQHDTYDRSGGLLVFVCGWATRVSGFYGGYLAMAENIAAGYATPQSVVAAWMGSPGHRANILSTSVWEIGVGYHCCGGTYTRYWGQDFGKQSGVYPLIINREAATTTSTSVDLYLYGNFSEMRLRNDSGSWGAWQSFSNAVSWTLDGGAGLHTVSGEFRTGSQVYAASDTIELIVSETATPSSTPTTAPSATPTTAPSASHTPTTAPSASHTPTTAPSATPTIAPSATPTTAPSATPTPTTAPSVTPTTVPSVTPTTVPSSTPTTVPSVTPTTVPSVTPTTVPSVTPTTVPSATPVPATATATATLQPIVTFHPVDDAYVDSANVNQNYGLGSALALQATTSSELRSFLKFDVAGLSGAPRSATLRLYVHDGSNDGGAIYAVSNTYQGSSTPWQEGGLVWNNAPTLTGNPLDSLGGVTSGSWVELTVTAAIGGNGTYSFGIQSGSPDRAIYFSRQRLSNRPELVIQP